MLTLKSTSTQRLNSTVDDIQIGLSKISTDQAATRSVLEETRNFSRDLTGQVSSTLVPAIQNLSAQCHSISSTQATQTTILSATRDSPFSIENDAAQIKAAVSQLVKWWKQRCALAGCRSSTGARKSYYGAHRRCSTHP
jgi:hypothetical protein